MAVDDITRRIAMMRLDGKPYAEIAKEMGMSVTAVYKRMQGLVSEKKRRTVEHIYPGMSGRMHEMGLNNKDLAEKLNVRPSYVSRVLTGKANVSVKQARRFADALGMTVDEAFKEAEHDIAR